MAAQAKSNENVATLQTEAQVKPRSKTALQKALYRLWRDKLTLFSGGVILLLAIACFSAPLIVDYVLDINYNDPDLYNSYLPIGSRVVDSDSTTWTWDAETGKSIRAFIGHTQSVTAAAFGAESSDLFVTGSADGEVRVWHIPSGRSQRRLNQHEGAVNSVAFSPDSATFATAGDDGTVKLWEREKADPNAEDIPLLVLEHDAAVNSIAYNADGSQILTGGADGQAQLWDTGSGESLLTLDTNSDSVNGVAFSPDGTLATTADAEGQVIIWDTGSGEALSTLAAHEGAVNSVAFHPNMTQVATAGDDGMAILWDAQSGEQLFTLEGHSGAINSVAFFSDGAQLVTASADGTARTWDTATGDLINTLDDLSYSIEQAVVSPDGSTIVTATEGRERFYILGTDSSGRDHISRLLYGGQVSLRIGFFAAVGALTIGIVVGVIAGYFGGPLDDLIIWFITTLNSIPSLFLLLIISALLAPNDTSLIMVLAILGWTGAARLVRGETFALREREFVLSAKALGASSFRIMFLHIVPNVISLLLIVLTRAIGGLILAESSLSFLGFGVKPPTPTWGNMLSGGLELLREAPHLVFAPGLLITVTVLCLYVFGDGLRDAFDPKIAD